MPVGSTSGCLLSGIQKPSSFCTGVRPLKGFKSCFTPLSSSSVMSAPPSAPAAAGSSTCSSKTDNNNSNNSKCSSSNIIRKCSSNRTNTSIRSINRSIKNKKILLHRRNRLGNHLYISCISFFFLLASNYIIFPVFCLHTSGGGSSLDPSSPKYISEEFAASATAPDLNFREDHDCLLTEGIPQNTAWVKTETVLSPYQWACHVEDEVIVNKELHAHQTKAIEYPGRESQAFLSFHIPEETFENGKAILALYTEGGTDSRNVHCGGPVLNITRMKDDSYMNTRDDSTASDDYITQSISALDDYKEIDISSLFYAKGFKGSSLHLRIREQAPFCSSDFVPPGSTNAPKLTLYILDTTPKDAEYDSWSAFSSCRVSCISSANYQCRKRNCIPGVGSGSACNPQKMLQKIPCVDSSIYTRCTCSDLQREGVCPANSGCTDSSTGGALCTCASKFTQESLQKETVCNLDTLSTVSSNTTFVLSSQTTTTTAAPTETNNLIYIIVGTVGGVLLLCLVAVIVLKPPTSSSRPAAGAGRDMMTQAAAAAAAANGYAGAPWQGAPQGMMASPYAPAAVPPGTRPPGPPRGF